MSYPNAIEVCRAELFTKEAELREMYNWFIATYKMAEKRKDSKTMERAATAYGKLNNHSIAAIFWWKVPSFWRECLPLHTNF